MCIIYYAVFATCPHKEFLGSHHCGYTGCGISSQHIFAIQDAGYRCEICILLDGKFELLELPPVEWYSPVSDIKLKLVKQPGMAFPRIVVVKQPGDDGDDGDDAQSCAFSHAESLSDVDSVTSYWRMDKEEKVDHVQAKMENGEKKSESDDSGGHVNGDALPAGFVRSPAKSAGSPASGIFGVSPNTVQHRNLVHDQLAALPEPFPTRPFAESPQRMSTPALRNTFMASFSPMLPAGLPSYPVLPPGLIHYPAYPPGMTGEQFPNMQVGPSGARGPSIMTGEHFLGLHRVSPAHGGPVMTGEYNPGLRVGPSVHGPPAMNGEHFPSLHAGPSAHGTSASGKPLPVFSTLAPYNMNVAAPYSRPAPGGGNGNPLFNMYAPFNLPARYSHPRAFDGTNINLNMDMNMSGFALNPLAPQFKGTPNRKDKARSRDDEWSLGKGTFDFR